MDVLSPNVYHPDPRSQPINYQHQQPQQPAPLITKRFVMVFDKTALICSDFKWLGIRISVLNWNPDHLQPDLFLTIQNLDQSGFQIPIVQNLLNV